jgi:hypothetical protein
MDDYEISNLSQAKNEYSARLVNILTPLVIDGIKSLFNDAKKMCIENNEKSKYLMTFQNFLARIPKWNNNVIDNETQRIIQESQCNYLEDLIVCVHIAQLKILTSIRVGQKQKKIDIDIPKINKFIHSVYIEVARKLYSNVYLFETDILPLNYQKNMRECEMIVRECIIDTVRNSIPVESILRSYIEETVEDEVEVKEEVIEKEVDISENQLGGGDEEEPTNQEPRIEEPTNQEITVSKEKQDVLNNESSLPNSENIKTLSTIKKQEEPFEEQENITLSFNNNDNVLNMGTNEETIIEAPKTIERLEEISNIRNEQRKLEEMEEEEDEPLEKLVIHSNNNIKLETDDIHDLNKPLDISKDMLLSDIEVIS